MLQENESVCNGRDYSTESLSESGTDSSGGVSSSLCDGLEYFVNNGLLNVYGALYSGRNEKEFAAVSFEVMGTMLCEGLSNFHTTLSTSLDGINNLSCQLESSPTCVELDLGQSANYESALDDLLLSYKNMYGGVMRNAMKCLSENIDIVSEAAINDVLYDSTMFLRRITIDAGNSAWSLFDRSITANGGTVTSFEQTMFGFLESTLGEAITNEISAKVELFNFERLVNETIVAPEITVSAEVLLIETSMKLIDTVFFELEATLSHAAKAVDTRMESLPPYINLPEIPTYVAVEYMCSDIIVVKHEHILLVDSVGSSEDYYCRAHLTACTSATTSPICLVGMDIRDSGNNKTSYLPFQFEGDKCEADHEELKKIINIRERLGQFQSYLPNRIL